MNSPYLRVVRWLVIPIVVAAIVVVVVIAGKLPTVPAGRIVRAADVTSQASGADLSGSLSIDLAGRSVNLGLSGYESIAKRTGELRFNASGVPGLPSGELFAMRFLYPVVYLRSRLFASAMPAGKRWLKINVARTLSQEGVNSTILSSEQSDPTQYLEYLKAARGRVQKLGTARIRGVMTTHYHTVTDLSRIAQTLPAGERAAAQKSYAQIAKLTGTDQFPIDVWIDGQHLIRRMKINLTLHPSTGSFRGQGLTEAMTIDLFNFGPKPPVAPPPSDQTESMGALAGTVAP